MKTRKAATPDLRWRVEIKNGNFTIFTKHEKEANWTQEALDTITDLPPIKWEVRKRTRETPGEQQTGPPQPRGGVTPPGDGGAGGAPRPAGVLPGLALGALGNVSRLATSFQQS